MQFSRETVPDSWAINGKGSVTIGGLCMWNNKLISYGRSQMHIHVML